MKNIIIFLTLIILSSDSFAQVSTSGDSVNHRKTRNFLLVSGAAYALSIAGLSELWYKHQENQSFRFFDDSDEWKQMDKVGHFFSAFHVSAFGRQAFYRQGIQSGKSAILGGLVGTLVLLPIEVFDGFSAAYGASWTDLAANTLGASFYVGQQLIWKEVRIHPKFSFHKTRLAPLRKNTLGSRLHEEILKDYNGQTYWLSVDLDRFFDQKNMSNFPKWLNLAVGYGSHNMLYAHDSENLDARLTPYRQYYLALDLDFSHIRLPPSNFGNKMLNGVLYLTNLIHLPAPALSYDHKNGIRFYPLYF